MRVFTRIPLEFHVVLEQLANSYNQISILYISYIRRFIFKQTKKKKRIYINPYSLEIRNISERFYELDYY